jgi:hypothetical protein
MPTDDPNVTDPTAGTGPPAVTVPVADVPMPPGPSRPDVVETPFDLFVLGPRPNATDPALWAAHVRILQWVTDPQGCEDRWFSRALRELYVDRVPPASPAPQALLGVTLVARCRLLTVRVTVNGVRSDYLGPVTNPVDVDLLLQADDSDWSATSGSTVNLGEAVCLAGEIPFDRFPIHPTAPPGQVRWTTRFPFLQNARNEALSSSGIMVDAQAVLPWSRPGDPPVSEARYIVEVALPPADPADSQTTALVVLPDLDRIDDARYKQARADYLAAFAALARSFRPVPPAGDSTLRKRPRWSSLDPSAGPNVLPGFSWSMKSDQGGANPRNSFQFDPGAWRLALSDQPDGVPGVSPRGVLSAAAVLGIAYGQPRPGPLVVNVTSDTPPAPDGLSTFSYTLSRDASGYHEQIAIANALTVYDPLAAAGLLRGVASLPPPSLDAPDGPADVDLLSGSSAPPTQNQSGRVVPPTLSGYVPLEDGWAKLPFLNATDQILTDILPEPPLATASASPGLFAGAASFGTDRAELFDPGSGEPGWNITVLDALAFAGIWTLGDDGLLDSATVSLAGPELTLEGLFWLATGAPTAEDALPTLDNWLTAVQSLPLETPDPLSPYPPPFAITFRTISFREKASGLPAPFSTSELGTTAFTYGANETKVTPADTRSPTIYEKILTGSGKAFDPATFWLDAPLVWRRHGTAPAVQALPMTQSKTPPNYPSGSRQLFPFALPLDTTSPLAKPGGWRFTSEGAGSSPRLAADVKLSAAVALDGLTLVSLGLPGLVFDPNLTASSFSAADPADAIMPAQYRHEVALLDEVNALATLPKDDAPAEAGASPPQPPPGLQPGDYAAFWAHLAELAFSATADARDALRPAPAGGALVAGLIEPFDWQASATLASAPFPGSITFADPNGHKLNLAGTAADALRGLEGPFRRSATVGRIELVDPSAAEFTVVGEAMGATLATPGQLRDQRGLYREATQVITAPSGSWLSTRVQFADDASPAFDPVRLWTASAPLSLAATATNSWDFWFRDVPAAGSGAASVFDPALGDSVQRRGENNPAALSRTRNHLNGYEWRLGSSGASPLPLGPLWFFPLSLGGAKFDAASGLVTASIVGRLHLPFDGKADPAAITEPVDNANAVRLTFSGGKLDSIAIESLDADGAPANPPVNEWPLADLTQKADAPVFRWTAVRLSVDKTSLLLTGRPVFVRHGVSWTFPEKVDIPFPLAGPVPDVVYAPTDLPTPTDPAVAIRGATLSFRFDAADTGPTGHSLSMGWRFTWGQPDQLRVEATYDDPVLARNPPKNGSIAPPVPSARLLVPGGTPLELSLQEAGGPLPLAPNLDAGAVQITWCGLVPPAQGAADSSSVQVLPGFHLSADPGRASRGFAVLSFALTDQAGGLPSIDQPVGGFVEALFGCEWGLPLQGPKPTAVGPAGDSDRRRRLFGSSAGRVDADYTATFDPINSTATAHKWAPQLLLNGFVEVKDLVSWPLGIISSTGADNRVTIPVVPPVVAAPQPFANLIRHTARILLDQHAVPPGLFVPGGSGILLTMGLNQAWCTTAVVEHQFVTVGVDITGAQVDPGPEHDVRMTLAQEVRFCAPSAFRQMLHVLFPLLTTDAKFPLSGATVLLQSPDVFLRSLPDTARGYFARGLVTLLIAGTDPILNLADADTIIVEASAPAMVRVAPVEGAATSNLAFLPGGTTLAYPSALSDYQSPTDDPRDAPQSWLLLALSFFGRTQPRGLDGLDAPAVAPAAGTPQPADLRVDPFIQLATGRALGLSPLNPLALAFANLADGAAISIGLAEFDMTRHRRFTRLDPASLRESWFRLNLPAPRLAAPAGPDVATLNPVLAVPPADEPGARGRPEAVARLLDPRRKSLPPKDDASQPAPLILSPPFAWHPDSLFLLDLAGSTLLNGNPGLSGNVLLTYGFLGVGAQWVQANLFPDAAKIVRQPAAAVLPARLAPSGLANVQPVSSAVSPYLGFDFQAALVVAPVDDWLLGLAELVCFDVGRRGVTSVSTRFFYPPKQGATTDALIRQWGLEVQSRLAADSPVGVIRLREIHGAPAPAQGVDTGGRVTVLYRFLASNPVVSPPDPVSRATALRAEPAAIRHAQGQYGGPKMPPKSLAPFELAPPQVAGVQPIRLNQRPADPTNHPWPWGLAALRIGVRYADGERSVVGPVIRIEADLDRDKVHGRLWWQSFNHVVQYAVPEDPKGRKVLPAMFRARAMPGLSPVWPTSPLPDSSDVQFELDRPDGPDDPAASPPSHDVFHAWQPVLPGGHAVLLAGARPGAPFAFREFLQTQDFADDSSVASGSVPVMHRTPRPVLLPPNVSGKPAIALQTWAGAFNPVATVGVGDSPADAAFLGLSTGDAGLDLVLTGADPTTPPGKAIAGGTIPLGSPTVAATNWDRILRFQADGHGQPIARWFPGEFVSTPVHLAPADGTPPFAFNLAALRTDGATSGEVDFVLAPGSTGPDPLKAETDRLNTWLAAATHGDAAEVRASVGFDATGGVKNFRQTLAFPVRVDRDQGALALPYRPKFFLFEDPEYNRRLASTTAQATAVVTAAQPGGGTITCNLTLAADRHEYNSSGTIHYLFYFDVPALNASASIQGAVTFQKVQADGGLVPNPAVPFNLPVNSLPLQTTQEDIGSLLPGVPLKPGDTLMLTLSVPLGGANPAIVSLGLPIVATPVTPVPEAGYALLRKNPDHSVECLRFAFSPSATRIELVDPDDLHRQTVRRRATFRWQATGRAAAEYTYAVQKITTGGSTHFPSL